MLSAYKIYSPDKKWRAEISARLGSNITKLQYEGKDVFIPLNSNEQLEKDPFLIGSPMLFPANRTYKGEFKFEGKKYQLPINDSLGVAHLHGFLYCQKFNLIEISEHKIELLYENLGYIYPFSFSVTVEYSLENNVFEQRFIIKNTDSKNMPYTFALHTAFVEPKFFTVPIDFCQEKDEKHIPTGKYIHLNEQEKGYVVGSKSENVIISGYYHSCGNTAYVGDYEYTVSQNFDHWVLYNGCGQAGLLCVEPQCGAVNGLNLVGGFKTLKPDSSEVFSTIITKIN